MNAPQLPAPDPAVLARNAQWAAYAASRKAAAAYSSVKAVRQVMDPMVALAERQIAASYRRGNS